MMRHGKHDEAACRKSYWYRRKKFSKSFKASLDVKLKMTFEVRDRLSYEIFTNNFEKSERDFVRSFLNPADVFFDVGANLGLFTLLAACCVGPQGRVYSFEPVDEVWIKLVKNVRLNDFQRNVIVNCLALSDEATQGEIWRCDDGFSAFSSMGMPVVASQIRMSRQKVQTETLDRYVHAAGISRMDLIKIDVEGWEDHVLSGAEETFRKFSPVILIEFTDACAQNAGSSTKQLRDRLESWGYRFYRYKSEEKRMMPEDRHGDYPYLNLVACKNEQLVQQRILKERQR